jgi:phosphotriesterase-related protein
MAEVMTVRGPVACSTLGRTSMHEHLLNDPQASLFQESFAALNDLDVAIREAQLFKDAGGGTIVDLSQRGPSPDIRLLQTISEATGLHIIASTGFYKEPYYPPEVYECTIVGLAERMTHDLRVGIRGTQVRAGIIGELGTNRHHITPAQERVFRAAARAQLQTGVAISTHTYWGGELALEQVRMLRDEGVPADRIIIGHLGDTHTFDYNSEIADTGAYIQFDHTGIDEAQRDEVRAQIVGGMVARGYLDQILLGCDTAYKLHLHEFGGHGYDYLLTSFVAMLESRGLSRETIDRMLIDNPRRALTGTA